MHPLRILSGLLLLLAAGAPASAQTDTAAAAGARSVMSGVYSAGQAERGQAAHKISCLGCHGAENYTGETFEKAWLNRTVFDFLDRLRNTMPDDNPGSVKHEDYVDIIAYILSVNGYPPGEKDLSYSEDSLRLVRIDVKPPGRKEPPGMGASSRDVLRTISRALHARELAAARLRGPDAPRAASRVPAIVRTHNR
jgi:S-disulfanyl-L-cysteine oxidoreductase SoxD